MRAAVAHVSGEIGASLIGRDALAQSEVDRAMLDLDGTRQLSRLGGNAILAVSIAVARAGADAIGVSLYRRLNALAGQPTPTLPMPMVNILSGGLHAARGMDVQDFLVIPVGAASYSQALDWACRIRSAAARLCEEAGITTLLADEGGLSPGFARSTDALDLMVRAFEHAGLTPGDDAAIALDIAASSLVDEHGRYQFARAGENLTSDEMIERLEHWTQRYPIVSIEDGLHEEDWANWPALTRRLGHIQLIGDDLFATQPGRIARGVEAGAGNCALIKINQNGTLTGLWRPSAGRAPAASRAWFRRGRARPRTLSSPIWRSGRRPARSRSGRCATPKGWPNTISCPASRKTAWRSRGWTRGR